MNKKTLAYLIFAGAVLASPVLSAAPGFWDKANALEKQVRNKPEEAVKAWTNFIQTEKMSAGEMQNIYGRLIRNIFAIKDAELQKKEFAKVLAAAKATKNAGILSNLAIQAAGVRNDPYHAEVLALADEVIAGNAEDDKSYVITKLAAVSKDYFNVAEKLAAKAKLTSDKNVSDVAFRLAENALRFTGDKALAGKYFAGLGKLLAAKKAVYKKDAAKAKKGQNVASFYPYRDVANRVFWCLEKYLEQNKDIAAVSFNSVKKDLPEDYQLWIELGLFGRYAVISGDLVTFNKAKAAALALPFGSPRGKIVDMLAQRAPMEIATELYMAEMKNPDMKPRDKFNRLGDLRSKCGNVNWFQRGFNDEGAYKRWKDLTDKMLDVNNSTEKKDLAGSEFYQRNANTAFGYGDFAFAEQQIARAMERAKEQKRANTQNMDTAVMIYLWKKDKKKVSELIENELKENKNADKLYWSVIDFFSKGGTMKKFDGKFKDLTSEEKLRIIRRASEMMFRGKRYDVCKDIYNDILNNQFISLEPKKYTAKYMDNPPQTADGFARTPLYKDWKNMETRFVPYGDNPNINTDTDVKRFLKDAKQPEITKGYETGIYCLYDTEGLHIYVRGNDADIHEVREGKRDAGMFECTFRPHADAPYHMWFMQQMPKALDDINLEYACPSPRYRNTQDYFRFDGALTPEGVVGHTFIPWIAFYDNLPTDGKCWYFGMQRWSKGGGQTISGQVHELARMLNIKFDFSEAVLKKIKLNLCKIAYNRFLQSYNLKVWKTDDKLGDPEFYNSELAPLVDELTIAGKLLEDKNVNIHEVFDKYMARWAEFEYTIAEKRNLYLKKKFFE